MNGPGYEFGKYVPTNLNLLLLYIKLNIQSKLIRPEATVTLVWIQKHIFSVVNISGRIVKDHLHT